MDTKRIVSAIIKTILTIALVVVIGMVVYKLGAQAYNFGYQIFAEEPVSPEPGLTMSVAIVEGKSVMEVGKILEEKGLIRSHYLFYFQELFSSYHGELQPGVFELCTAMTPEEMIEIMATTTLPETEEVLTEDTDGADSYDSDNPDYNPDKLELSDEVSDNSAGDAEDSAE